MQEPESVIIEKAVIALDLSSGLQRSASEPPTIEKAPAPVIPRRVLNTRNILMF
jgi:hypothetical protein